MYIIESIQFFNNTTSPQESEVLLNVGGSQLTLNVTGSATTFAIKVLGSASIKSDDSWSTLAPINLGDYSISNTIATKGIYAVPVDGIGRIKLSLVETNGAISVSGKVGA